MEKYNEKEWIYEEEGYDSETNLVKETIFGLSNGYMGVRGALEEGSIVSQPTFFVNGIFDKSETFMRELVNLPNWLGLKIYVDKELMSPDIMEVHMFKRRIDMKKGSLLRKMILEDSKGRISIVEYERFLSMNNVHLGLIKCSFTPVNYSGVIEVESEIDATVVNFKDAPRFRVRHTDIVNKDVVMENAQFVEVKTRDLDSHIMIGTNIGIYNAKKEKIGDNRKCQSFHGVEVIFEDFYANEGKTVQINKIVSVYTQRDVKREDFKKYLCNDMKKLDFDFFNEELKRHKSKLDSMWQRARIDINGDLLLQTAVRYNIFQLMTSASQNDERINIGAKLLHGEEYGGHAFWDTEMFMLPFFIMIFPRIAKNLLMYRYHLLEAAKNNAAKNGYRGAQYPWESADLGNEECPDYTIYPDGSCHPCFVAKYEHHVTAAVAYGINKYYEMTNDEIFMFDYGIEIMIETARFWASRVSYNSVLDRYDIFKVTGPDEWHEPVDNNFYTNYLAKWNMEKGIELIEWLFQSHKSEYENLKKKINFTEYEIKKIKEISEKVYIPKANREGIIEQFEGFFKLMNMEINEYDEEDMPVRPVIPNGMTFNETQISKQADVLMLLYLFGNSFNKETIKNNFEYYEKRSMHGSSLSMSIHSILGFNCEVSDLAYRYLKRSAFIDLRNLQDNTREGIHAANAGGVWQVIVYGIAGVSFNEFNEICFNPKLPKEIKSLEFSLEYRGILMSVNIKDDNEILVNLIQGGKLTYWINKKNIYRNSVII